MTITGLTSAEVEKNKALGSNKLTEIPREPFWKELLGAFKDPIIEILCVALIANLVFAVLGYSSWVEPIGIAVAVLLATLVGTIPEYKNEGAFQKLKAEASKIICKVYRDNLLTEIPIDDIVCNDVVHLQPGDKIPADGHIINGSIKVDQSVLNGESKEASKEFIDGVEYDISNKDYLDKQTVYRGTIVSSGSCDMVVDVVGDNTEYGTIARELQEDTDRETPLELKLSKLANQIKWFGYIGGVIIALAIIFVGMRKLMPLDGGMNQSNIVQIVQIIVNSIIVAMALIVMAVPEGLPLLISLVSAMNMKKMLADKILVRVRNSIETAGSLNILFSDKTGTITKNKLEAIVFVSGDGEQFEQYTLLSKELQDLYRYCAVGTSEASIKVIDDELHVVGSNPTDRAIVQFTGVHAVDDGDIDVVKRVEFSSANKYSGAQLGGKCAGTYIKGAVEKILNMCGTYYDQQGNKVTIDKEVSDKLNKKIKDLAGRMIRVLAIARTDEQVSGDSLPDKGYTLIGLVGVRDEIRPEAKTAIADVKKADIQVVMITGDSPDTAIAIAKEVNLIENADDFLLIEKGEDANKFNSSNPKEVVLTSKALNEIPDDKVKEMVSYIRVIPRAVPTDKSRMVQLSQELNKTVGMTGDGVNDSIALKRADIGFAMGDGTEVAKEAGDIVILDNNFKNIAKTILYGRTIYNNIRKFITYQLSINVGAVVLMIIATLLGKEAPLSVTQMLWVNLIMDTLAAIAFGSEPALQEYMAEKAKRRDEALINGYMWSALGLSSVVAVAGTLVMAGISDTAGIFDTVSFYKSGITSKGTAIFSVFVFSAIFNAFNTRTDKINLLSKITLSKMFLKVMAAIMLVQVLLIYIGGPMFNCYGLNIKAWIAVLALSIVVIPADLIRKSVLKILSK